MTHTFESKNFISRRFHNGNIKKNKKMKKKKINDDSISQIIPGNFTPARGFQEWREEQNISRKDCGTTGREKSFEII